MGLQKNCVLNPYENWKRGYLEVYTPTNIYYIFIKDKKIPALVIVGEAAAFTNDPPSNRKVLAAKEERDSP